MWRNARREGKRGEKKGVMNRNVKRVSMSNFSAVIKSVFWAEHGGHMGSKKGARLRGDASAIYAVVLLSGPSLAFWGVIIWAKFVFYKTLFVKNTIKIGVSALFFWKKNCARKFEVLLSGPSWPFLSCSQLGPDNNTYLAQIITPQNAFFVFFAFKNLLKYLFL